MRTCADARLFQAQGPWHSNALQRSRPLNCHGISLQAEMQNWEAVYDRLLASQRLGPPLPPALHGAGSTGSSNSGGLPVAQPSQGGGSDDELVLPHCAIWCAPGGIGVSHRRVGTSCSALCLRYDLLNLAQRLGSPTYRLHLVAQCP